MTDTKQLTPTEDEIALTLALYNADHENPDEHVLREHWDSWWDHVLPRATMSRYLRMAQAALARSGLARQEPVAWRWRFAGSEIWNFTDDADHARYRETRPDNPSEVQPLYLASSPLPDARVRPLEWRAIGDQWQADTSIGWYSIRPDQADDFTHSLYLSAAPVRSFRSIDEAKAAAEADYEQRILSALVSEAMVQNANKVYLASRYSRAAEMRRYRDELIENGFVVTSRWIDGGHELTKEGSTQAAHSERARFATEDRADLMSADIVISFTEEPRKTTTRGGRHVELGFALASGKRNVVVGYRENVFHCLPEVEFHEYWATAIRALTSEPAK